MAQNGVHFSPEQIRELAARYGGSHHADPGANTVIAVRR
jgi:hypothetical protein